MFAWIADIAATISAWFRSLFAERGYEAVVTDEVPENLEKRYLYLVGRSPEFWLSMMTCPYGCGETISLPMTKGTRPCWRLGGTMSRPSLTPSVWRKIGCQSHFVLRGGQVVWCRPNYRD